MDWVHSTVRWIRTQCSTLDEHTVSFFRTHANLVTAIAALLDFAWGCVSGHVVFTIGTIVLGAFSYFVGLSIALMSGLIVTIVDLTHGSYSVPSAVIELVGFTCISWLGFAHRGQQRQRKKVELTEQREREEVNGHHDQVLPWAVANEVRTSLAAVRFLLFPILSEENSKELIQATTELSRLEKIFTKIEEKKMDDEHP